VEVQLHSFLNSAVESTEWPNSHPWFPLNGRSCDQDSLEKGRLCNQLVISLVA
jgi:hypothetical protein